MIKIIESIFQNLSVWGLPVLIIIVGVIEFAFGLYDKKWTQNELVLDITCFVIPRIILQPMIVLFYIEITAGYFARIKGRVFLGSFLVGIFYHCSCG